MGLTKTALFTEDQNHMADLFRALGHPARIAIIEYLLKTKSCVCGDIVSELPLSQPTVSQHLKELKSVGLIKGSIEGNSICYCIDGERFNALTEILTKMNSSLKEKETNCC
jgi:ArsR family transcriptional regulator, arsenate/arsenite/antimonite-responsive transcriptional repressor